MKNKYRVVTDCLLGYEVQVKYWWLPFFWIGICTAHTIEQAKKDIEDHRNKGKVVLK